MTGPNLRVLRIRIEARMTGRCKLVHFTVEPDPITGLDVVTEHVDLDNVRCLIRPDNAVAQAVISAPTDIEQVKAWHIVRLPAATAIPAAATTIVPTASDGNPAMVGVPMVIVDQSYDDWRTAVRLRVWADIVTT